MVTTEHGCGVVSPREPPNTATSRRLPDGAAVAGRRQCLQVWRQAWATSGVVWRGAAWTSSGADVAEGADRDSRCQSERTQFSRDAGVVAVPGWTSAVERPPCRMTWPELEG